MSAPLTERYLSLLKKALINELYIEAEAQIDNLAVNLLMAQVLPRQQLVQEALNIRQMPVFARVAENKAVGDVLTLMEGGPHIPGGTREMTELRNFSFVAHTMIGRARIDSLHACMDLVTKEGVAGDFIETGVWRGGATIFMRAYLMAHGISDRKVWVADSFQGLPKSSHAADLPYGDFSENSFPYLSVSLETVKELFARYDVLDEQVCFLKGWFKDTLPTAPIQQLAILRLDGDLYESTMDAISNLYDKLSPGGFVIVDDYYAFPSCAVAINEFRDKHGIDAPLVKIDASSTLWRKPA